MQNSLKKDKKCLRCSSFFEVGHPKKGGGIFFADVLCENCALQCDEKFWMLDVNLSFPQSVTVTNRIIAFFKYGITTNLHS